MLAHMHAFKFYKYTGTRTYTLLLLFWLKGPGALGEGNRTV